MQRLPLAIKIKKSELRIREWYEHWQGDGYVAFSGGLDSTVLLHLVRSLYPEVQAVYNHTGLEYPENVEQVERFDNVVTLKPKMNFKEVIEHYGYPIISKEQAQYINEFRNTKSDKLRNTRQYGNKSGRGKVSDKWFYLTDAPFKISDRCCYVLKKRPVHQYEKETGNHPFLGILAEESSKRVQDYLKYGGCNAYESNRPVSKPLGFWTHADIWEYIREYNVPYSRLYDMGYERSGCMWCGFGCHLESTPNRFQRMAITHPKQYHYCMEQLGLREVLKYIGVEYRPLNQIPGYMGEQQELPFFDE